VGAARPRLAGQLTAPGDGKRVAGLDPGTISFDVCGLHDGEVCLDLSLPTAELAGDPRPLVDALVRHGPFELVLGPSGYGLPLVGVEQLGQRELSLMLLVRADERGAQVGIGGLRASIRALAAARLPLVFAPAVIHLPTVPAHRKWNRIDMGTADKVAAAALCVVDQARRLQIPPAASSFIMLELGGAFTAALAVQDGQIVDGLGGSSGPIGARACGALDGEVAYLLGGALSKQTLFGGGALVDAGELDFADLRALESSRRDPRLRDGWTALEEGATKAVLALSATVSAPREILLSGRLAALAELRAALERRLSHLAPLRTVTGLGARASSAAQGAAVIADGLVGGRHAGVVEQLGITRAHGSALDHVRLPGAESIKLA